jgi:hypothetical protein
MDPRLRTAVDASRRWYDDVFGLHGIPVRVAGGLWSALGQPPPYHSAAKTLERRVDTARVVRAVDAFEHCSVADSFGDLELDRYGFDLLFEASWVHRGPVDHTTRRLPDGWSLVDTPDSLAEWSVAHDYVGVLPPAVLHHPSFQILACRRDGLLVGGGVTHRGDGDVGAGISNAWGVGAVAESGELLAGASALHPGQSLTDFAEGVELDAMLACGFTALGPQRVWVR